MRVPAVAIALSLFIGTAFLSRAEAAIVPVFNTGVDNTGSPLPDLSADAHYSLIQVPAGSGFGSQTFVADSTTYPVSDQTWIPNSLVSQWIGPQGDQSMFPNDTGVGIYVYRATFDLTGFNPATATITGQWSTDNNGNDILINGVSTGITHQSSGPSTFSFFTPITISSGFTPGINTLDFVVENLPLSLRPPPGLINPTGLRVELSVTADPAAVPEPTSFVQVLTLLVTMLTGALARRPVLTVGRQHSDHLRERLP